ncbi:hypothetical protein MO973_09355 [Paenibacillus sp. TRM 82003]|nr:hypothetical protein [Paenibacillus sp. TRM 82003]
MAANKSGGYYNSYVHDPLSSDADSVRLESKEIDGVLDEQLMEDVMNRTKEDNRKEADNEY